MFISSPLEYIFGINDASNIFTFEKIILNNFKFWNKIRDTNKTKYSINNRV